LPELPDARMDTRKLIEHSPHRAHEAKFALRRSGTNF